MPQTLTGTLHGNTITLDVIRPIPKELRTERQRVRVNLEPLDDAEIELSPEQQAQLLREWAESGPQGPIEHG